MGRRLIPAKGLFDFNRAIDAASSKVEGVAVGEFRKAVWAVFCELVYTTPQFSGRAAANWNIGVGAPDFSVDYTLGEDMDIIDAKSGGKKFTWVEAKKVGDDKWASEALERNKPRLRQIKSDTKVYITNAVQGDIDVERGRSSKFYLADLQDPTYWANRLRDENQPYETVSMVLLMESWRLRLPLSIIDKEFFT